MIYEITVKRHWIDVTKTNQTLGLAQMFNGALGLAEAMGPHDSVTTQMDEYTAFVCQECGIETFGMVLEAQPDDEGASS